MIHLAILVFYMNLNIIPTSELIMLHEGEHSKSRTTNHGIILRHKSIELLWIGIDTWSYAITMFFFMSWRLD
jgi:hypothetical protein